MKNPDVKVTIVGGPGTGKSAIAFALKDILDEHNIASEIVGCEDEKKHVLHSTYNLRLGSMRSKKVLIETVQCKGE